MKIVLCEDGVCDPPKCPVVDVQENQVTIGEKDNVCTLTREQFDILKEKINKKLIVIIIAPTIRYAINVIFNERIKKFIKPQESLA